MSAIPQPSPGPWPRLVPPPGVQRPVDGGTAKAGEVYPLISAPSTLGSVLEARYGGSFADQPLPGMTLGLLLGAASRYQERLQPRGATTGLGVSVVCLNLDHELDGMVAQFHAERHALIAVQPAPLWEDLAGPLEAEEIDGAPSIVVLLWADPAQLPDRRLTSSGTMTSGAARDRHQVLLHGGAMLHSLNLMVAELGLWGCPLDTSEETSDLPLADLVQVPGAWWVAGLAVGLPS